MNPIAHRAARIASNLDSHLGRRQRISILDSKAIASVQYDRWRRELEVEFVNGALYLYFDVSRSVYRGILGADSRGHMSMRRS